MKGPAPTGFLGNSAPSFSTAVGDTIMPGRPAKRNGKPPYGSFRLNTTVEASGVP
jgi:hypothetical protein